MTDDKIQKFPVRHSDRIKNRHGKRAVICEITGRWLRFEEKYSVGPENKNWVFVDVMAMAEDNIPEKARKITQLLISKEDLLRALENIESA